MLNLFALWVLWHFVFPVLACILFVILLFMAFALGGFVRAVKQRRKVTNVH